MVNAFYLQIAGLRASVYFDYVPSKANIADLPSRDDLATLMSEIIGFDIPPDEPTDLSVPDIGDWNAPLESWLDRYAQLSPEVGFP